MAARLLTVTAEEGGASQDKELRAVPEGLKETAVGSMPHVVVLMQLLLREGRGRGIIT